MKKGISIIGIILFSTCVKAQTGGVSASKLATVSALPVPQRKIEFEPSLAVSYFSQYYNTSRELISYFEDNDSINIESEMSMRFTYGLNESTEVGMFLPVDADNISIGAKYQFLDLKNISIAALAGVNLNINSSVPKGKRKYEESDLMSTGLVVTWQLNDKFSVDMDGQYQFTLNKTTDQHKYDGFLDIDAGYYVFSWLQPILGLNYRISDFLVCTTDIFTTVLNAGFTIEPAEQFLMVINAPIMLGGKNTDRIFGFGFALTITLE